MACLLVFAAPFSHKHGRELVTFRSARFVEQAGTANKTSNCLTRTRYCTTLRNLGISTEEHGKLKPEKRKSCPGRAEIFGRRLDIQDAVSTFCSFHACKAQRE